MRRKLSIIVGVIIAIGLVVGVALPGLATADEALPQVNNTPPKVLKGRVIDIDEDESLFVIQSGEQEPVIIATDSNTKYLKLSAPRRIANLIRN